jgi:hypothetical protein
LSPEEISELDDYSGPAGQYAPHLVSVHVIDGADADHNRTRRYELRVAGVTGTFCAEYFTVDVLEGGVDDCLVEWSVRMPNGEELLLHAEERQGGLLDLETLRYAFRHAVSRALGWGRTFRDIVPAPGMTEAVVDIADALRKIALQLQAVEPYAGDLPAEAGAALGEALRTARNLPIHVAEFEELFARVKPVGPPH